MGNTTSQTHRAPSGVSEVPQPLKPKHQKHLPRPLTFFVSANERTAILRTLRTHNRDRAAALLIALDIPADGSNARRDVSKR